MGGVIGVHLIKEQKRRFLSMIIFGRKYSPSELIILQLKFVSPIREKSKGKEGT